METIKAPDLRTLNVDTLKIPENDAPRAKEPPRHYSGEDRMPQVNALTKELSDALRQYERMRCELHAHLGSIWLIEDRYESLVGQASPLWDERLYFQVNLPRLLPVPPRADAMWNTNFSTTQQAHQGYMASYRKGWPAPPSSGYPEDAIED